MALHGDWSNNCIGGFVHFMSVFLDYPINVLANISNHFIIDLRNDSTVNLYDRHSLLIHKPFMAACNVCLLRLNTIK